MSYFNYQSKKIYYTETGSGKPVLFLHGNTASSRMFEFLLPLYEDKFHVILIDFLGHGRSDRVEEFPADLWMEEASQTIALMEHLKLGKVNLVGTSGGAWVAINAALKRPDLVDRVVADSFDGRALADDFSDNLIQERTSARNDEMGVEFYKWCQGEDWERIVDMDTKALLQCAAAKLPLFIKPLESLQAPLLLTGSEGDEMSRSDFQEEYREIAARTGAEICVFSEGGHPAILSSRERAAGVICRFLE
ncbi:alpha/beta hydrolase [Ruminococcus sp. OA3]|uniref:alpha/beta fold hydrolase n=1 Tax=Ruminococcus sp. OA3 TaxID=2914164 RepID=UPI001F068CB1|nr:alpha/beta hydrolase [Ruminococcus sp. OA3]MCH1984117.1 alpha/beta hydrolase [Ruminococcus sp. OA3]